MLCKHCPVLCRSLLVPFQTDLAAMQQQCEEQLTQCMQANNMSQHQIGELDTKLQTVQRSTETKVRRTLGFTGGCNLL